MGILCLRQNVSNKMVFFVKPTPVFSKCKTKDVSLIGPKSFGLRCPFRPGSGKKASSLIFGLRIMSNPSCNSIEKTLSGTGILSGSKLFITDSISLGFAIFAANDQSSDL